MLPVTYLLPFFLAAVQAYDRIQAWPDKDVPTPKGFVANVIGHPCRLQVVFEQGISHKRVWDYSILGVTELDDGSISRVHLPQEQIRRNDPISVVNAASGTLDGAFRYRLGMNKRYSLLPIQFDGCRSDLKLYEYYQVKATEHGGSAGTWYSPVIEVKSHNPPDQVTHLSVHRVKGDRSKIHVAWHVKNQHGNSRFHFHSQHDIAGAFVIAGRSPFDKKNLKSKFVATGKNHATIEVGSAPVNVTVARYSYRGNGALSPLQGTPQVEV